MKLLTKILLATLLLAGVDSAFAETQDRHLSGFRAISLSGAYDVFITQGSGESVKVEAPSDVINNIVTELKGDVLAIHDRNQHFHWGDIFSGRKKIAVYVSVRDLRSISLSGSGDIFFKEGLNANKLDLSITGSGNVIGRLNAKDVQISITGSGDVKLSGRADLSAVIVSGSGDFSGRDLLTSTTMVRVSGSGDASVYASQKLDAQVSGSGDIRYAGGAKQVSTKISGSGEIHRN